LLDKQHFPRDKPCGDALGGKALSIASLLGVRGEIAKRAFLRQSGVVFSSPNGSEVEIQVDGGADGEGGGFVCRRRDFDSILFSNAKKICDAHDGAEVADVLQEDGRFCGVRVKMEGGAVREFFANLLVGADGAASLVARKAGVFSSDAHHTCSAVRGYYSGVAGLRKNIEVHFLQECMPGYFWIFPLSETEANIGVGMLISDMVSKKANLQKVLAECMKNKRFGKRFERSRLHGGLSGWSIPLASAHRRCSGNGWVLIGDAASLVDPFSGEGIGNGLKSAAIAAGTLASAARLGPVGPEKCAEYERTLWSEIGSDVQSSYMLQKMGKVPFLIDIAIGKAKRSKWVRDEFSAMISSREAKGRASDPLFSLRVLLS